MTDRELLELVEEGMAIHSPNSPEYIVCAALRERLAQPEAPVLTGVDCSCGRKWRIVNNTLTASEPETVMAEYKFQTYAAYKAGGEMKLGVVPEQEPVAWMSPGRQSLEFAREDTVYGSHTIPLYTADQMREYAKKAVEAEREACAGVCEQEAEKWRKKDLLGYVAVLVDDAAVAIRARR